MARLDSYTFGGWTNIEPWLINAPALAFPSMWSPIRQCWCQNARARLIANALARAHFFESPCPCANKSGHLCVLPASSDPGSRRWIQVRGSGSEPDRDTFKAYCQTRPTRRRFLLIGCETQYAQTGAQMNRGYPCHAAVHIYDLPDYRQQSTSDIPTGRNFPSASRAQCVAPCRCRPETRER